MVFPGSSATTKIEPKKLNGILLHTVPKAWTKQSYIQGWYFAGSSYKDTCDMLEHMEIVESIYKEGAPSQNTQWEEAERASFDRETKEGGAASSSNPEKFRAGKRKRNDGVHSIGELTGETKRACCMALGTLPKSAKCLRTTPKKTPRSSHLKTSEPDPSATTNTLRPSSLTARCKKLTP